MFAGIVEQGEDITLTFLVKNSSGVPVQADAAPRYRVYGPEGLVAGQVGDSSERDTGVVTDATNASPIVVSSSGHGLETGDRVTISGVTGNLAANGTFFVTKVNGDSFSLDGSTGNGAYGSGGTWRVTGLYKVTISATAGNGFEKGETYTVYVSGTVSAAAWGDLLSFLVG